ncbi:MAG: Maf family protein [Planctomycetota bacterium]
MTRLILASSSPRRRQLLAAAGFEFEVVAPSDGAEPETIDGLGPAGLVRELARLKGQDVARRLGVPVDAASPGRGSDRVVLAADTVAECSGRVLGKPKDKADAREMLSWLSGREHHVLTGVYLAGGGLVAAAEVAVTRLRMAPLEQAWLEPFLATGGWRGKAGAFGYQDGLDFVRVVEGSESNVVGLPIERAAVLLGERGCWPGGTLDA